MSVGRFGAIVEETRVGLMRFGHGVADCRVSVASHLVERLLLGRLLFVWMLVCSNDGRIQIVYIVCLIAVVGLVFTHQIAGLFILKKVRIG